jgi:SAM-dependent methyltransferase
MARLRTLLSNSLFGTNPSTQSSRARNALLETWKRGLTRGQDIDPHSAVVAELGEYFRLDPAAARERCENWTRYSLTEWCAGDRTTDRGLRDFFDQQTSWIFDTMWYHANQCDGGAPAESVDIALGLSHLEPGRQLDFGAGPGSSAIFFNHLGWDTSLLDISKTMRAFAAWRLERRNLKAPIFADVSQLPLDSYDLITAFDVMVHVPNAGSVIERLHHSLKLGGYLVFNIDNRPVSLENHGHLYEDQWPILRTVRRAGFRRLPKISYFHVYEKVSRSPLETNLVAAFDRMRYNRAVTGVGNTVRGVLRNLPARLSLRAYEAALWAIGA